MALKKEQLDTSFQEKKKFSLFGLVFMTLIGTFFSYWIFFVMVFMICSKEDIKVVLKNFQSSNQNYGIKYVEPTNFKNFILLDEQLPIADNLGISSSLDGSLYRFSLLVTEKSQGISYQITALPSEVNTLNPGYVKVYLEKNNKKVDFSYHLGNGVKVFTDYLESQHSNVVGRVIYQDQVNLDDIEKGRIDFTVRMWIRDDLILEDDFHDKAFGIKINTYVLNQ